MTDLIPLCLLRIWCRLNDSWLSFKTTTKDRYLVNPSGYFIELPDGSLSAISPRQTFPLYDRFPSVPLDLLVARKQYGDDAKFLAVPIVVPREVEPRKVLPAELLEDPFSSMPAAYDLKPIERYVLLRCLECGLVSRAGLPKVWELRRRYRSIGSALISSNICQWESLLSYCLDTRPPSRLDPPSLRTLIERREWELIGEILHSMGMINRTQLEYGLKIKRDGSQALGQILTSMGACKQDDIDRCLEIQAVIKNPPGHEVALIGRLLVRQGVISDEDLDEALRHQQIARQSIGRILLSMGACTMRDIEDFKRISGGFQAELDDISLGNYLLKTDTITKIHLEEALRIQQRGRQVLGELLVSMGLCSGKDIENVLQLQREVRETHRSGVEKLGSILIHCGKVPPAKIDEAVKLQSMGRQPFGAILLALGACSAEDIMLALDIQHRWRSQGRSAGDRLGEVLVQHGIISEEKLAQPLLEHMREEKPLGRILIERNLCSPEDIIDALINRDHRRHYDFLRFVSSRLSPPAKSKTGETNLPSASSENESKKNTLSDRLSTWFTRPKGKS